MTGHMCVCRDQIGHSQDIMSSSIYVQATTLGQLSAEWLCITFRAQTGGPTLATSAQPNTLPLSF